MFISAKMWIPDPEDEDDISVVPVHITSELTDSDNIFIDFALSEQLIQLEIGEHAAMLFAMDLIAKSAVSRGMREADLEVAMTTINRALEGDDEAEEE